MSTKSSAKVAGDAAPLGIYGGTFDPVHLAHLRLAEEAADQLGLAAVRWIPAGQPYHRSSQAQASAAQRLAMVELAVAGNPRFSVDAAEVGQEAPSYTVATLRRLRQELGPKQSLVLLLGADAFAGVDRWHEWRELFALAHIAVATRPGYALDDDLPPALLDELHARQGCAADLVDAPAGRIVLFAMTPLAIAATHVRSLLTSGASARYLLPDAVVAYIEKHRLYRSA